MKKIIFAALLLSATTSLAGGDKGNGGMTVVCFNSPASKTQVLNILERNAQPGVVPQDPISAVAHDIRSVELLDLYKARLANPASIIDDGGLDERQITENRMALIKSKVEFYNVIVEAKNDSNWAPSDGGVLAVNDANDGAIYNDHCTTLQIARQVKVGDAFDIDFDIRLYAMLNPVDQSALKMHEWIYNIGITKGQHTDSRATRKLVSYIYAKNFSALEPKAVAKYIQSLKFRSLVECRGSSCLDLNEDYVVIADVPSDKPIFYYSRSQKMVYGTQSVQLANVGPVQVKSVAIKEIEMRLSENSPNKTLQDLTALSLEKAVEIRNVSPGLPKTSAKTLVYLNKELIGFSTTAPLSVYGLSLSAGYDIYLYPDTKRVETIQANYPASDAIDLGPISFFMHDGALIDFQNQKPVALWSLEIKTPYGTCKPYKAYERKTLRSSSPNQIIELHDNAVPEGCQTTIPGFSMEAYVKFDRQFVATFVGIIPYKNLSCKAGISLHPNGKAKTCHKADSARYDFEGYETFYSDGAEDIELYPSGKLKSVYLNGNLVKVTKAKRGKVNKEVVCFEKRKAEFSEDGQLLSCEP